MIILTNEINNKNQVKWDELKNNQRLKYKTRIYKIHIIYLIWILIKECMNKIKINIKIRTKMIFYNRIKIKEIIKINNSRIIILVKIRKVRVKIRKVQS